jgi:hypothetical protein
MPYMEAEKYRERERRWREEAKSRPDGAESDACVALADGYAHLVELIERLDRDRSSGVER